MLTLLTCLALAEDPAEVPPPEPKANWSVFPVAGVDSDDGFGFGARAQWDTPKPGVLPYGQGYVIHLFLTTKGYHHHRFKFDLVGLGERGRGRLTGHFAFRAWLNDGYWGLGNGSRHDLAYDDLESDDPLSKFYHYQLIQPFSHLTLRNEVATLGKGALSAYGSWEGRYSIIRPYEGSLLAQEQPYGVNGGPATQLTLGVLWDSRSPETTPTGGALLEASARVVAMADGADLQLGVFTPSAFGGPMLSARRYLPLGSRLTWATRLMGEWLFGPVPFYEMVHWGGFVPIAGVGGADTLRGASFGRWHAPAKAVAQSELRIDVLQHRAFKRDTRWQLVPFGDVATVWGLDPSLAGEAELYDAEIPLHPAAGMGIRLIWATTLVGRLDVGIGQDRIEDGRSAPSLGFYLAFDHTY